MDLWGGRRELGDRVKLAVFSQDLAQVPSHDCLLRNSALVMSDAVQVQWLAHAGSADGEAGAGLCSGHRA